MADVAEQRMVYFAVDKKLRLLTIPDERFDDFCSQWPCVDAKTGQRTKLHSRNFAELVGKDKVAKSREGWMRGECQGLHALHQVHYLQHIHTLELVLVPDWNVSGFVADVAKRRKDMAGLRSVDSVTKFVRKRAICGKVRTVYGDNWRLVATEDRPVDPRRLVDGKDRPVFQRAPLPWDADFVGAQAHMLFTTTP